MQELTPKSAPQHIFKAGQFWTSNVFGAAVGGAGAGILMSVVMVIVVSENPTRNNILFATGLVLILVLSALCLLPGNLIAGYPYAVELEEGTGLLVQAPLRKLSIPIQAVQDVRKTFLQPGYVVRLNRRYGLLKSFLIPSYFGEEGEALANAIQKEIWQLHDSAK